MKPLKKRELSRLVTPEQFQEYKTLIIRRAVNRTKAFKDNGQNYYWYKLKELEKIEANSKLEV